MNKDIKLLPVQKKMINIFKKRIEIYQDGYQSENKLACGTTTCLKELEKEMDGKYIDYSKYQHQREFVNDIIKINKKYILVDNFSHSFFNEQKRTASLVSPSELSHKMNNIAKRQKKKIIAFEGGYEDDSYLDKEDIMELIEYYDLDYRKIKLYELVYRSINSVIYKLIRYKSGHCDKTGFNKIHCSDEDILGHKKIKEILKKLIIDPYKNNNHERIRGILLYGYPGNGKTLLCNYIGSKITNHISFIDFYERAWKERIIDTRPPVIIMDDVDMYIDGSEATAREIMELVENEQLDRSLFILVVNSTKKIPSKLARSGRLDLWLLVDGPKMEDIERVINDFKYKGKSDIDFYAKKLHGCSFSDLKLLEKLVNIYKDVDFAVEQMMLRLKQINEKDNYNYG